MANTRSGNDDGGNDSQDSERTDSDDDENLSFTLKDYEEEEQEQDEESMLTPKKEKSDDEEKMYEEKDDDVAKFVYKEEDAHVTLTTVHDKTEGPLQSFFVPSNFTSKLLNLDNTGPDVNEIASLMNTSTVPPPPPPVNPSSHLLIIPQQQTLDSTTTTTNPTMTLPEISNFASVFQFDQRVFALETKVSEFNKISQFSQALSLILSIVDNYLASKLKRELNTNKSSNRSDIQKNLYNALVEAYNLDKDIITSYGDVVTLKRGGDDQDKDEDPSAGSNRGMKRSKSSKDAEPLKGSKSKELKSSSSSKGTQSQPKSSERREYPFDLSKPLPLIVDQGRQVVPADYFIKNDIEYLKGGSSSSKYATSTTRTKAAKYDNIEGIEDIIAQKEEAGIQITYKEFDSMAVAGAYEETERDNANCTLENNLQQASTSGTQSDKAPVYDTNESTEYTELLVPIPEPHQVPQNDSNVISMVSRMKKGRGIVEQHYANVEETRAYHESLFHNLAAEVEKVNSNGLIGVQGNGIQNPIGNGNLVAARAKGNTAGQNANQIRCYNCRGLGHYDRNCTARPMRRDAAYLQTQLLIAQKEEAGIQLQAEEYDLMAAAADLDEIEEINANCILMVNLQQASSSEEQYTELLEPIPEPQQVPQYDNNVIFEVTDVEQDGETVEQHPANFEGTRALYESLYHNLAVEVEKVNSVNRKLKETNADLTTELARVQNFKIQFLKEAAKLVRDFKSLAKEADESLAKHNALELEIERLLRVVVSQDIMSIVQNPSVVDSSNLQTELERTKERFENCLIKRRMNMLNFGMIAQLGDLKGSSKDTSCVSDTLDHLPQKLKNENVDLEF
nr:hypothetical protein [Tanacetum cinerariifolium]